MSRHRRTVPGTCGLTTPVNRCAVRIGATTGNTTLNAGRNATLVTPVCTAAAVVEPLNLTLYCVVRVGFTRNATAPLELVVCGPGAGDHAVVPMVRTSNVAVCPLMPRPAAVSVARTCVVPG